MQDDHFSYKNCYQHGSCEYEIEYEYDFSITGRRFKIVICPTNIVPIVSFSTGQQQGGAS